MNVSTIDLRNATFQSLQENIHAMSAMVLQAWRTHGRGTTRLVAEMARIDLLTFRPRTTELVQIGLVKLIGRIGTEGLYEAATPEEVRAFLAGQQRAEIQPELKLQ
jgi:hypothetical protein